MAVMKTRQFKQLGSMPKAARDTLLADGLGRVAENVTAMIREIDETTQISAVRSTRLMWNVAREEAGKFLVLIDLYRVPDADQKTQSDQLGRASTHLAKLLYAQMADYSIGDRREMVRALNRHRESLHLDGPNDFDFIMPNDLITERESALYVDLVEVEGHLEWWAPSEPFSYSVPSRSMRLVDALARTGLISVEGFKCLQEAWADFDHLEDSTYSAWGARTEHALVRLADSRPPADALRWSEIAGEVVDWWPMPLVHLDLGLNKVTEAELVAERDKQYEAWLASEYGHPA